MSLTDWLLKPVCSPEYCWVPSIACWEYMGQEGSKTQDIKNNLRAYDISIPIGLSYTFDYGFFIDGRYNISLCDIMNQSTNMSSNSKE